MAMAGRIAVGALLALVALAPPALACSWVLPTPYQEFEWLDARTLLTHDRHRLGRYDVDRAAFSPLEPLPMDASPQTAFAAAPDGRSVAFAFGGAVPPTDFGASCDTRPGQTLVRDLASGRDTLLLPGGAGALAASARHLAVAHDAQDALLLYPWDALGSPQRMPVEQGAGDDAFNLTGVRSLAFSPDGTKLAVLQWFATGRVFVLAVPDGRVLDAFTPARDGAHIDLAWSPDGGHLAVLVSPRNANGTMELRQVGAKGTERVALHEDPAALTALDWAPEGLAVAWTRYDHGADHPREAGVHLFLRPPSLEHRTRAFPGTAFRGDVAFATDGARLAVSEEGKVRLLDRVLHAGETDYQPHAAPAPIPAPGLLLALASAGAAAFMLQGRLRRR